MAKSGYGEGEANPVDVQALGSKLKQLVQTLSELRSQEWTSLPGEQAELDLESIIEAEPDVRDVIEEDESAIMRRFAEIDSRSSEIIRSLVSWKRPDTQGGSAKDTTAHDILDLLEEVSGFYQEYSLLEKQMKKIQSEVANKKRPHPDRTPAKVAKSNFPDYGTIASEITSTLSSTSSSGVTHPYAATGVAAAILLVGAVGAIAAKKISDELVAKNTQFIDWSGKTADLIAATSGLIANVDSSIPVTVAKAIASIVASALLVKGLAKAFPKIIQGVQKFIPYSKKGKIAAAMSMATLTAVAAATAVIAHISNLAPAVAAAPAATAAAATAFVSTPGFIASIQGLVTAGAAMAGGPAAVILGTMALSSLLGKTGLGKNTFTKAIQALGSGMGGAAGIAYAVNKLIPGTIRVAGVTAPAMDKLITLAGPTGAMLLAGAAIGLGIPALKKAYNAASTRLTKKTTEGSEPRVETLRTEEKHAHRVIQKVKGLTNRAKASLSAKTTTIQGFMGACTALLKSVGVGGASRVMNFILEHRIFSLSMVAGAAMVGVRSGLTPDILKRITPEQIKEICKGVAGLIAEYTPGEDMPDKLAMGIATAVVSSVLLLIAEKVALPAIKGTFNRVLKPLGNLILTHKRKAGSLTTLGMVIYTIYNNPTAQELAAFAGQYLPTVAMATGGISAFILTTAAVAILNKIVLRDKTVTQQGLLKNISSGISGANFLLFFAGMAPATSPIALLAKTIGTAAYGTMPMIIGAVGGIGISVIRAAWDKYQNSTPTRQPSSSLKRKVARGTAAIAMMGGSALATVNKFLPDSAVATYTQNAAELGIAFLKAIPPALMNNPDATVALTVALSTAAILVATQGKKAKATIAKIAAITTVGTAAFAAAKNSMDYLEDYIEPIRNILTRGDIISYELGTALAVSIVTLIACDLLHVAVDMVKNASRAPVLAAKVFDTTEEASTWQRVKAGAAPVTYLLKTPSVLLAGALMMAQAYINDPDRLSYGSRATELIPTPTVLIGILDNMGITPSTMVQGIIDALPSTGQAAFGALFIPTFFGMASILRNYSEWNETLKRKLSSTISGGLTAAAFVGSILAGFNPLGVPLSDTIRKQAEDLRAFSGSNPLVGALLYPLVVGFGAAFVTGLLDWGFTKWKGTEARFEHAMESGKVEPGAGLSEFEEFEKERRDGAARGETQLENSLAKAKAEKHAFPNTTVEEWRDFKDNKAKWIQATNGQTPLIDQDRQQEYAFWKAKQKGLIPTDMKLAEYENFRELEGFAEGAGYELTVADYRSFMAAVKRGKAAAATSDSDMGDLESYLDFKIAQRDGTAFKYATFTQWKEFKADQKLVSENDPAAIGGDTQIEYEYLKEEQANTLLNVTRRRKEGLIPFRKEELLYTEPETLEEFQARKEGELKKLAEPAAAKTIQTAFKGYKLKAQEKAAAEARAAAEAKEAEEKRQKVGVSDVLAKLLDEAISSDDKVKLLENALLLPGAEQAIQEFLESLATPRRGIGSSEQTQSTLVLNENNIGIIRHLFAQIMQSPNSPVAEVLSRIVAANSPIPAAARRPIRITDTALPRPVPAALPQQKIISHVSKEMGRKSPTREITIEAVTALSEHLNLTENNLGKRPTELTDDLRQHLSVKSQNLFDSLQTKAEKAAFVIIATEELKKQQGRAI